MDYTGNLISRIARFCPRLLKGVYNSSFDDNVMAIVIAPVDITINFFSDLSSSCKSIDRGITRDWLIRVRRVKEKHFENVASLLSKVQVSLPRRATPI